ncbi:MAG: translocation/assembly module TamB domain-containing protein [Marinobacter sp.]|uniref:translocation/assembly module TamB domain-containing protein n=1 Tax=Marinobacter sp. TaxID=50741 RepID=UPI00299E0E8C|nr:translocation/assembly module TamB domain-containing protein [Marinobacter sp.]MDX1757597.1 translocation/assembly module TamB domain-containing protein [Marinobacter sp.]
MRRPIHWLRWAGAALLIVVLVLTLLVSVLILALRSDTGTRWVIEQIPGLQVSGDQGTLLGQWQAQWLRWHGYGVELEVKEPLLDWSPSCLFEKRLCVDVLHAEAIDLTVQPGNGDEDAADLTLPVVELPLALSLGDVDLGPMSFNGSPVWTNAQLVASGSGPAWVLERLSYRLEDISVTARGRVESRGDWPVNLTVEAELPPPYGDRWRVGLELAGSVADLRVSGRSAGYLDAAIQGRTQPLTSGLPARIKLTSPHFLALDTLPETLTLKDWMVTLEGSLADGFKTHSRASLPGTAGEVSTTLDGVLTTAGAERLQLRMQTAAADGRGEGLLAVNGDLSWEAGMAATAAVELQQFPWHTLLPDVAPPEVVLKTFSAEGRYDQGDYRAQFSASVSGPLGDASLAGRAEGDLESVRLQRLKLTTGGGLARGDARVSYADELAWEAQLALDRFDPGYWAPWLQARLNGNVTTTGRLREGDLQLKADWRLAGRWQQQDASSAGSILAEGGRWTVSESSLSVGPNRLRAEGQWGRQVSALFELEVPDPAVLLPGLAGTLSARLSASGTPEALDGNLQLNGAGLAWQDALALEALSVSASLTDGQSLQARAEGQALAVAGQSLDQVTAELGGSLAQHVLTLRTRQRELITRLVASGGWQNGWRGQLSEGELALPEQQQQWVLEQPIAIDYGPDGSLTLGAHCWRWQQSTVCADNQALLPDLAISYQLREFPTEALAPLLPDTLRWQSQLNGQLALTMSDQGPDGVLRLRADQGQFDVYLVDEWHALDYQTLSADVTLAASDATVTLELTGPRIGQFHTRVSVDPTERDYPMDGQFDLRGLDLTLLGPLLDLEAVSGRLEGRGRLSGPLVAPQVFGDLSLSGGSLVDQRLPFPLEQVAVGVALRGQSATVDGRWQSNDRSEGLVTGELDWSGSPTVALDISGSRLPFAYEPYADVELEPDLAVRFASGDLRISGKLAVPRGQVQIRRLPEQAVSPSEDEVIVGESGEEPVLRSILMDVVVSVGSDRVTFDGFGVLGDLEGTLRLGNDLDARGVLQLTHGTFEAYGQELKLRRARLVFVGPIQEPYLDIEAIREVETVVAGLRLSGPVTEPRTEVFSEPAMSQGDALSYVILGRPLRSEGDEGQVSQAAISLGLTQASKVTQKIGEEIGIEQLILETEGSGEEASVVASGYLTDELSVRYGVGLFEPISTVALRYELGRYFYLEAASGLAASLDIFYTRDF